MTRTFRVLSAWAAMILLVGVSRIPAKTQEHQLRKQGNLATLAAGPNSASQDFGDVAVLVDNGVMVTSRNLFDLNGKTLSFEPSGPLGYTVSQSTAVIDSDFGPELRFGYPGAVFPGDDDSQEVPFTAGFPFFGTNYYSAWVNCDGNITFGGPDHSSDERDKAMHALGLPRISGFLNDWSPLNALNPVGQGSIHAVYKSNPSRLVATWNGVRDWNFGGSSTFQIILYTTGRIDMILAHIDPVSVYGVTGIAAGGGLTPFVATDFATPTSAQSYEGGAIMEAFAPKAWVNKRQVAREFYKTHPDKFDILSIVTDFPADSIFHAVAVKNQTHGIGAPLDASNGQYVSGILGTGIYDLSAQYGSGGELEMLTFMNNINLLPSNLESVTNPPIQPYSSTSNVFLSTDLFGFPVALDGQTMSQIRIGGILPEDDGEWTSIFPHAGSYSLRLFYYLAIMAHEMGHRWSVNLRFVHPTKGTGFDSYDLLGRGITHWSYFVNTGVPGSQFPDAPRSSVMEGNAITDLGTPGYVNGVATNLAPGERVFQTPANVLADGFTVLDQHLMGLRLASEVGTFWYVDEPRSIYNGMSLDGFNPFNPLDTLTTMRSYSPMGGIVFAGKRVDLTMKNIQDWEAIREGNANPKGRRFWGPRGNLKVRYFSDSGRVDPNGDASVILSESDRELGDEADTIDASGRPIDMKTVAFVLVVKDGPPGTHGTAVSLVDNLRKAWEAYMNGPATGGRGKFDTRLNPFIH